MNLSKVGVEQHITNVDFYWMVYLKIVSKNGQSKEVEVLYQGSDQSMIPTITKELEEQGYEGTMINIGSAKYECKRHSGVLKVKSFKLVISM